MSLKITNLSTPPMKNLPKKNKRQQNEYILKRSCACSKGGCLISDTNLVCGCIKLGQRCNGLCFCSKNCKIKSMNANNKKFYNLTKKANKLVGYEDDTQNLINNNI